MFQAVIYWHYVVLHVFKALVMILACYRITHKDTRDLPQEAAVVVGGAMQNKQSSL